MKRSYMPFSVGTILGASLLSAGPAGAACSIFEHANYGGWRKELGGGAGWTFVGRSANDKASSIKVDRGCQFVAYADANYGGASWTYKADTPNVGAANDKISSGKCFCAVQVEVGPTVEATIERTLPRALDAVRGGLEAALKKELGRGDLVARGFTLYNLNPRIGRLKVRVHGNNGLIVTVTDNYLYGKTTQPSIVGSSGDPAFEVHFDFTMTARLDASRGKPRLNDENIQVTRLTVKGRNLVGNAALLVGNFFNAGERGRQILERELRENFATRVRDPINEALAR